MFNSDCLPDTVCLEPKEGFKKTIKVIDNKLTVCWMDENELKVNTDRGPKVMKQPSKKALKLQA